MTDFDYDCLQKKRLARQAQYRKRGSKSKRCPMSTDHMTVKQWKERNGRIVSVSFERPTPWANFKELSKGAQEEYLRYLSATYGANATNLAEMFDVSVSTIRRYIQTSGLDIKFQVGHSMSAEQRSAWEAFLSDDQNAVSEPQEPAATHEANGSAKSSMQMSKFSICFAGAIDVDMISNSLKHILGESASGQVEVICSLMPECR